jgi:hypothetical protein
MISIKPVRENASFSIRDNLDRDSNVTQESDPQSEKHFPAKTSANERRISSKPVLANASIVIRDSLDPDSNVTEESDPDAKK